MARNDGIDRTLARNQDLETPDDVTKVQEHNEREKDRYSNVTIPFVDRFPRGEIYDLLTTRPEDLAHERTDE
ncbi:MAG: hypothetical protein OGM81_05670 [Oscillospiraceae bacterium]|nr:MAG: hypothetical protein OGM81_05670 [Oscillospiraceae bacterium]